MEASLKSPTAYDIEEKKLNKDATFVILGVNNTCKFTCDIKGCTKAEYGPIGPECDSIRSLVGCKNHCVEYHCICPFDLKKYNNPVHKGYQLIQKFDYKGTCTKYRGEKRRYFMRCSYDESCKKAQETTKLEKEVRNNTESLKTFQDMVADKLLMMDEKLEEIKAGSQMRARREPDDSQMRARREPEEQGDGRQGR